jgi:hypothetical protein
MISINNLIFFIFIFSSINILRLIFLFLISVFQNPPKKLEVSKYETFYYLFLISYIITYLTNNN